MLVFVVVVFRLVPWQEGIARAGINYILYGLWIGVLECLSGCVLREKVSARMDALNDD